MAMAFWLWRPLAMAGHNRGLNVVVCCLLLQPFDHRSPVAKYYHADHVSIS